MTSDFSILGKSVARKDAIEKVTGNARYVVDMQLPAMLYAKFLRSPYAHARVKSIDTTKAEALPGVKCVLTHKNVPRVHPARKLELLLDETVHYPGEEVAAVAAVNSYIAEEAVKLIEIEYEVLPSVFDAEEALQPGAPLAHEDYGSNIYHGSGQIKIPRLDKDGWLRLEVGDINNGFAEADHVLDGNYETPVQYNCSPMPRAVICEWAGDKLTCWADTQVPFAVWQDTARSLNIPQSHVRVIADYSVGGYGGKRPGKTATLVAIMAKRSGRPVKAVFSRAEDFIGTHHRISFKTYNKIGVKMDGTITAMYSKIIGNWGCDAGTPYISQATGIVACNMLYNWKNSKAETCAVLTNLQNYGAMNGFGSPEAIYSIEKIVDEAAEKIGMDPVDFRYRNCIRYGSKAMEYEHVITGPVTWGILGSDMDCFPELILRCAETAMWKEKWKGWRTPVAVNGYKKRGIGAGTGLHHTTFWPSAAIVKMNHDGTASVLSGANEIGQGYATAIAQVVAETLGISYDAVNPILADTGVTPASRGNIASTGTSSAINAAKLAAEDARHRLFEVASRRLGVSMADLEAKNGKILVKGTDNSVPIADICLTDWQIIGFGKNPPRDNIRDERTGQVIHAFAAAFAIVEVEVDVETGAVEVIRIVAGHDTGKSINPVIVENQIDLGLTMANGWVRTENYVTDPKTGVILNPNLLDYKLVTFLDVPENDNLQRIVVEKPCAWGPFGAKGMSETAMTALGPAIANAVYNATGVRVNNFLSPENVLKALSLRKE